MPPGTLHSLCMLLPEPAAGLLAPPQCLSAIERPMRAETAQLRCRGEYGPFHTPSLQLLPSLGALFLVPLHWSYSSPQLHAQRQDSLLHAGLRISRSSQ